MTTNKINMDPSSCLDWSSLFEKTLCSVFTRCVRFAFRARGRRFFLRCGYICLLLMQFSLSLSFSFSIVFQETKVGKSFDIKTFVVIQRKALILNDWKGILECKKKMCFELRILLLFVEPWISKGDKKAYKQTCSP